MSSEPEVPQMKNEGGCLCRAVRFSIEGEPLSSIVCHCRTCRKASATPSVGWLTFHRNALEVTEGAVQGFRSSSAVTRSFCGHCGTPLFYANEDDPETVDITTVSMDDPALFPPTREVWLSHKLSWEATNGELTHFPRGSKEGPSNGT